MPSHQKSSNKTAQQSRSKAAAKLAAMGAAKSVLDAKPATMGAAKPAAMDAAKSSSNPAAKPNHSFSARKPLVKAVARVANRLSPRKTSDSENLYESIPSDRSENTFKLCNSSEPCCSPSNDNLVCLREETRKELQCLPPSEVKEKRLVCEQSYELRVRRCFYEDPCPEPAAPAKSATHTAPPGATSGAPSKTPSEVPSSTKTEKYDYLHPSVPIQPPSSVDASEPKSAFGEQQVDSGIVSEQGSGEAIEESANGEQQFADELSEVVEEENGLIGEIPSVFSVPEDEDITEEEDGTSGELTSAEDIATEETPAGEEAYDEHEFRPEEEDSGDEEETPAEEDTYTHENEGEEEKMTNGFEEEEKEIAKRSEEEQGEEVDGYEETPAEEDTYTHENEGEEEKMTNGFEEEQADGGEEEDEYDTASEGEDDLEIKEEDGWDTTFTTIDEEDRGEDYMEKGKVISQISCSYKTGVKDCSDRSKQPSDIVVAKISRRKC